MRIKRILSLAAMLASVAFAQAPTANIQVFGEVPAGTLNGSNAAFTLNYVPVSSTLALFRNGVRQKLGTDYSVTANHITFTAGSVPIAGDLLLADYVTGSLLSSSNTWTGANSFNSGTLTLNNPQVNNISLGGYLGEIDSSWNLVLSGSANVFLRAHSGYYVILDTGNGLQTKAFATGLRSVTGSDLASVSDHTLLLSGSFTETLPSSPVVGQELYLVNSGSSQIAIAGNGHSIWNAGTNSPSVNLAPNATAILQFDGTLWRQIK